MAIIKDIDKGGGEIIRIEITEYKGKHYLNLRVWYTDKETGDYKPTQKGIALKPEFYAELKDGVLAAEEALANLD
ncbi:MAG: transcriptional coactivator p15/PC4 family protein [Leptospirales bacterium]